MFARPALRLGSRQTYSFLRNNTTAFTPRTNSNNVIRSAAAGLKTSAKQNDPAISVTSYRDGERRMEELQVPEPGADEPVRLPGQDTQRVVKPFSAAAFSELTPTMRRFTLLNKVAVITGGARGLGHNMAQALAEVGVRGIAILDVQQDLGDRAAQELSEQSGIDVRFYRADVRDGLAMNQTMEDIVSHFGEMNVVINAAGIADSNIKAETYDHEKFRRLIDINVTGSFLVAQAAAQQFIKSQRGGSIINIASMSGSVVNYPQEQSCYNASKAAVIQMTKSLAAEWAKYGIRVNSISPGYMDTALNRVPALEAQKRIWVDHTPQKRLGAVDDLNNLAVYLASDGSAFMTGSNCIIDGGYTLW